MLKRYNWICDETAAVASEQEQEVTIDKRQVFKGRCQKFEEMPRDIKDPEVMIQKESATSEGRLVLESLIKDIAMHQDDSNSFFDRCKMDTNYVSTDTAACSKF